MPALPAVCHPADRDLRCIAAVVANDFGRCHRRVCPRRTEDTGEAVAEEQTTKAGRERAMTAQQRQAAFDRQAQAHTNNNLTLSIGRRSKRRSRATMRTPSGRM